MNVADEIARMEAVIVPECDCILTWQGVGIHRPDCPRLAALYAKYRPNDPLPEKKEDRG